MPTCRDARGELRICHAYNHAPVMNIISLLMNILLSHTRPYTRTDIHQEMAARLITVYGATGQQGGPVARALLASGFAVRAVTRNPDSEKALALKKAGAELFKGDLDDRSTIDAAVAGAYGVFLVTDYFTILHRVHDDKVAEAEEVAQGKAVADASVRAGVKHFVYSGLPEAKDIVHHPVPHFDGKAAVERYLDEIGLPNTSVRYTCYHENFTSYFKAQLQADGTYSITLPMDGPLHSISVEDGGPVVAAVFKNPGEFIGRKFGITGDYKTVGEYAAVISKVTGKTVKYNQVPVEVFATFPFPGADELAYMFDFYKKASFQDQALTKKLNPNVLSIEEWAQRNKDKL